MSDAAPKPKTREALRRAGDGEQITHRELARRAGVGFEEVRRAIFRRTDAERAGKICVALGEMAGLTPAERREIFAELIHSPGETQTRETQVFRVSTEDPNFFLDELSNPEKEGHYPPRKPDRASEDRELE